MEEYIISINSKENLEDFYNDMETVGGTSTIPDREVHCCCRRPISRNTHYMLTPEEAEKIKNDPRVFGVEVRLPREMVRARPRWEQNSNNWDKSSTLAANHKNWGILRCVEGQQISGWGSDGTSNQSGVVTTTSSGKHVDVVIGDGHLDPSHPEFSVNSDGTGGSRVIQYNWYQHNPEVIGASAGTYVYPTSSDWGNGQDNHGMHVAGTVAGNTQGWARDSNIYNITPYYYGDYSTIWGTYATFQDYYDASDFIFDYIRAFHNNKSVNPVTGRKNPTISNHSWGSILPIARSGINAIQWRGSQYTPAGASFSDAELEGYGILVYDANNIYIDYWNSSWIVDIQDAIDDGVVVVSAAGNDNYRMDVNGGPDYNNLIFFTIGSTQYGAYYHRGSWNVGGSNVICVGSVSNVSTEVKASYSNCGPRVDIYAPGTRIMSSVHNGRVETSSGIGITLSTVSDPRNSSYELIKYQGTSMASPQVCGVLACVLEQYPSMNQQDCLDYLTQHGKLNQLASGASSDYTDVDDIKGSANRYLFYYKDRQEFGNTIPKVAFKTRKSSGQVFPRQNSKFT